MIFMYFYILYDFSLTTLFCPIVILLFFFSLSIYLPIFHVTFFFSTHLTYLLPSMFFFINILFLSFLLSFFHHLLTFFPLPPYRLKKMVIESPFISDEVFFLCFPFSLRITMKFWCLVRFALSNIFWREISYAIIFVLLFNISIFTF